MTKKIFASLAALPVFILSAHNALAQSTPLDNPLGTDTTPWELFSRIASGLNFITATLAMVVVVIGGYMILTAAGNSERFGKGKQAVTYAIIGLLVTTATYTILATTINVLTGGAQPFKNTPGLVDPINLANGDLTQFAPKFYGERILGFLLQTLGGLTVLMFIYAGFLWLIAAGNQERISKAKRTLGYAIIGLVIVFSSYIFVNFAYTPFVQALS